MHLSFGDDRAVAAILRLRARPEEECRSHSDDDRPRHRRGQIWENLTGKGNVEHLDADDPVVGDLPGIGLVVVVSLDHPTTRIATDYPVDHQWPILVLHGRVISDDVADLRLAFAQYDDVADVVGGLHGVTTYHEQGRRPSEFGRPEIPADRNQRH